MKMNKKILMIVILAVLALTLGACSGGRRIAAAGWAGVTIAEDTVYFSYGPQAYALNLNNGSQKWVFPADPEPNADYYAAPTFLEDNSQLIVAGYDGTINSIDPLNGIKNWTFAGAEDRYISAPLVTDGGIFAPSSDSTLYALDFDGILQWQFNTEEPLWASPAWSESCGCIYQVSMDRFLYSLDPETGSLLWKSEDLGGPIVSHPSVSESGLIVLGTFNNEILAINEESRDVVWRYQTTDWVWASPIIDGEQVFASDIGGTFYALDLESGELLWQIQPGGGIYAPPAINGDLIYISTDASSLVVVNRDGVIQRNQPVDGKLYASPVFYDGNLYLAPSEAEYYLIALNESGVQIWGYPPAE
jgi:outer membrane protein assembly factor BamB